METAPVWAGVAQGTTIPPSWRRKLKCSEVPHEMARTYPTMHRHVDNDADDGRHVDLNEAGY